MFREYIRQIVGITPAVLVAIVFHEVAHGYVAYLCGDDTAKRAGRLTLNPLKHLDPIGTIMLILFKFGWAKPVPVNFYNFRHPRRDIILVSLAGPLTNFILAVILSFFYFRFGFYKYSTLFTFYSIKSSPIVMYLSDVIGYSILINLVLLIFNLIPIPPLDGSKVFMVLIPERYRMSYAYLERYGVIILLILILTGVIGHILNPGLRFFINLLARIATIGM